MIIDDHVHVGLEVGGPTMQRKMWISHSLRELERSPDEKHYGCMGARHFFVNAGRWDKKYLDPNTIPPYTVDDLIYSMDDAGVDKSVLIGRDYQVPWPPYRRVVADADYVTRIVEKYPDRLVGTAPMNPWEMNCEKRIKYYVEDLHLKGIAEVYTPTGIDPADREKMYPIYEACVEYDITCFVHAATMGLASRPVRRGGGPLFPTGNYPYGNPRRFEEVGLDFPDLKLMMHNYGTCRGPVGQLVKKFPNFRTHAVYRLPPWDKEWILWCQENIPDQVHMGSDHLWGFPVKGIVEWIQNIPELTEEFKKKVFETNPRKFYKF